MLAGVIARARSLWLGLRRRPAVEAEMAEEFRAHIELRAADLVRGGFSQRDALTQARREFGSTERYKEEGRASRGLKRFDELRFSWLDFKLGLRMLVKYPGLTIVAGIALAFAMWVGASTFEFVNQFVYPRLPLPNGDRIVALRNWDLKANRSDAGAAHDYITWRAELESFENLGAARRLSRNLIVPGGLAAPVRIAEITASAFPLTGGTPLLGRTLVEADEQPGATPVVVIGFDVWQTRFGGDPNVVGRTVGLGRTTATVVGVMPERFRFPIADDLWVPLRLSTADRERRQGPGLLIFGRLANGVTLDRAQAELTTLGLRAAADFPETHGHLRPQVKPFAKSYLGLSQSDSLFVVSLNLVAVLLLMLIGANVALLVFARAAARESEIIVRNALGASRGRIIVQLFTEALVLSTLAALVGLVAARSGLRWSMSVYEDVFYSSGSWPFWIRPTLSHTTVLYVSLLAVLAAALAGVVPALKITRSLGMRLKQSSAGGGGLRFGGVWTAIVITQVAVTVAFPAVAFFVRREAREDVSHDPGFSHAEYLSVRLELDSETQTGLSEAAARAAFQAQFAASINELERKLESNAAVSGVTFARLLPRMQHPWNQIEVDAGAVEPTDERGHRVGRVPVGIDYFDVLGTTVLSGRNFHTGDLAADARVVIVNQPFVDQVLGGRSALGRRIRYTRSPTLGISTAPKDGPWFEIVGVVRDLGTVSNYGRAGVYHPEARGAHYPTHMIAHVKGQPAAFAHELRAAAAAVDPMLRLNALLPLNKVDNGQPTFLSFWFKLVTVLCALSLLLSLAAIYAVTSFTVARRTPEIGIRVALGADARHVARAIFWRPVTHVAIGIAIGAALVGILTLDWVGSLPSAKQASLLAVYGLCMMAVCLLACIVPTRRALRIQPTDALKAET